MERALCWIRRDLRLADHVALAEATSQAERVAVVFVFDRLILGALEDRDDRRLTFIHRSLAEVDAALRGHGSRLIALHGDPVELIPNLAHRLRAQTVFFNGDVEPYALQRDREVRARLEELGIGAEVSKDHVIFARREVVSGAGTPFRVYSPYARAWKERLTEAEYRSHDPDPARLWPAEALPLEFGALPPLSELGFTENDLWLEPGEVAGLARLREFAAGRLNHYADRRNLFAEESTSGLSVHLRHGTVSIRACVRAALGERRPRVRETTRTSGPDAGGEKWLNELIWRDFYHMILSEFPHVNEGAFQPQYDAIEWPGDPEHFAAWRDGRTGYPVVDAAMRCFNATGWMHNRLRMIVAMFLTKDLLLDWRLGEGYFARRLLDFDLAPNNGGWQWSASTGVDAQPYFRIFNPVLQSERFDPAGAFLAEWCPELAAFPAKLRHWPHDASEFAQSDARCILGTDYPRPVVNHKSQAARAVALFSSVR